MAQLAEGFGFDLADALAGYLEGLAYLFEGVFAAVLEAEAQSEALGGGIIFSFLISCLMLVTIPFTRRKQAVYDMIVGIVAVRGFKAAKPHRDRFDSAEAA